MPQLDPTWFASQLFWLFVSFVVLYTVLARIVLPPLMGIMGQRKTTVESDLTSAQSFKTQAEKAREEYERTMAEARARSQQLIADAALAQKTKSEAAAKELEAQIASKLRDAEKKIAVKKQELMDSLTPATAELTAEIVEKLTSTKPGSEKVKAAISSMEKAR